MICAYCRQEKKSTKEHIISSSILDLFPECFATIDNIRGIVHLRDPIVKDVCAKCNNDRISYIDCYGKKLISNYSIKKYKKGDKLEFSYDYTLVQKMLLKYSFNDLRSQKKDISFFNEDILELLMNVDVINPLENVTVLAGLAINTSPVPDCFFGNNKIRWSKNPVFLSNSIIEHLDYETGKITNRSENTSQEFKKLKFSYIFRFNSIQFLLICWEDDISNDELEMNNIVLKYQYPYTILGSQGKNILSRCTSEITYNFENLIDVSWGQGIFDDITRMRGTYSEETQPEVCKTIKKDDIMTEQDHAKRQLIEQLDKVNMRLQILDMIENKLLKIRELAQRVVEEDLTKKKIEEINKQVQELVAEVELLDSEPTQLS